jgi:hypothetical protein
VRRTLEVQFAHYVHTVHHSAVLGNLSVKQGGPHISVFSLCTCDEAAPSDAWPVRRLPRSLSLRRHVSLPSAAAGMSWRKLSSVRLTRMRQASRATA